MLATFAKFGINLLLLILTTCGDIVSTLLIHCWFQPAWGRLREFKAKKAIILEKNFEGTTYRSLAPVSEMHLTISVQKLDTMDKVFQYAIQQNGPKKCLGSREVHGEEDEVQPNGKVFKKYNLGSYLWKTYDEVDRIAVDFSLGLKELGMKPKSRVAIFAETRTEWMISAIAAFRQNFTLVTLYATLGEDAIVHGLKETEVEFVITSHEQLPKFKSILMQTPAVKNVIYMEDPLVTTDTSGYRKDVEILPFCGVTKSGSRVKTSKVEPPKAEDIAIVMYTSGSTGAPKGVLLSHLNLATAMMGFADALGVVTDEDAYMAVLPLAHVFELVCESICFLSGVRLGYSSPNTMVDTSTKIKRGCKGDAALVKPTILACVPLILDRIYKNVQEAVNEKNFLLRTVFEYFYSYKLFWFKWGFDTPILNMTIFKPICQKVGGRIRYLASGGAPLSPDVHEFVRTTLCAKVLQGYGLTETTATATITLASEMDTGRVGPPLNCNYIKLESWEEGSYSTRDKPYPRGEILIGGNNVAQGYFKLPEATKQDFFVSGGRRWFRTGDIGEMHDDGVLKIIDRKKDLVKLQYGEYLSLGKVEAEFKTCSVVDNICVYADSTKLTCVALVVPNPKQLQIIADKFGVGNLPFEKQCTNLDVEKAALKEMEAHGIRRHLQKFEIPAAITLCEDVWLPETGLVTAALKLKRKNVQLKYQDDINRMYAESG